jgi:sulfur carrier protein
MSITVNGELQEDAGDLIALLARMGLHDAVVATALNGTFIPSARRATTTLRAGDHVEILAPMQGG